MKRIDERFDRTPRIESSRNYDRDSKKAPLDGAPLVATKNMEFWSPAQHSTSFFQAKAASDITKFKGVVIDNSGVAHRANEDDQRALIGISLDTAITGENVRVLQVGVLPKGALPETLVLEIGKNVYMSGIGELNSTGAGILVGYMSEDEELHLLMSGGAGSGGGSGGGVPDGGNKGEVLTKLSGENGDAAWMPPSINGAMDYTVVGGIMRFPMITPPEGWLRMDGSVITKTDYPDLWNAIGDVFLSHLDHPLDISFTGPQNGKYNVTASVSNTSYEAWRIFNYPGGKDPGINDRFWRSASTDAWVQLDFGEDNVIPCRFRIVSVNNIAANTGNVPASASGVGASTGPKKFKILGSKNGTDWTDLTAELEHDLWGAREQFWCFCKENPARDRTYRYIRLHVLESHNPSFVEIGAFDIYFLYSNDVKENEFCVGNGGYFMGDIPDGERFVGAHEPNTFPYWLPGGLFRTQGAASGTNVDAATTYAGSASWEMFENGAGRAPSSYAPEHTHIPVYIRCKPAVYDGSGQSSLFVGKIEFFHELNAPEGWLYLDGSVLNNASTAYPRLWEHLKNSPWKCCTEEQWQQMSTDAGGVGGVWRYVMDAAQNTLRLMDVRGDSVRFAGGKKDDTTYWQVGDWHPDATQHVTGEFAMWTGSYAPFVASQYDANPTAHATGPFTKGTRVSNGVNPAGQSGGYKVAWDNSLAARTADEERVRAGNLLPCVYTGNGSRGDVWGTGGGGGGGDGDLSVTVKNRTLWGCSFYNDTTLNSEHTYTKAAGIQRISLVQDDPQWADVVDIHVDTENQCYTMPEDGIIAVEFRGSSINLDSNTSLVASGASNTCILSMRINDADVVIEPAQQANGRSYDARMSAIVRVKKGDKIAFYVNGSISGVGINFSNLRTVVAYITNLADVTVTGSGGGSSGGSGVPLYEVGDIITSENEAKNSAYYLKLEDTPMLYPTAKYPELAALLGNKFIPEYCRALATDPVPAMTSVSAPAPYRVAVSSAYANSAYAAVNAWKKSETAEWLSANGTNAGWTALSFGETSNFHLSHFSMTDRPAYFISNREIEVYIGENPSFDVDDWKLVCTVKYEDKIHGWEHNAVHYVPDYANTPKIGKVKFNFPHPMSGPAYINQGYAGACNIRLYCVSEEQLNSFAGQFAVPARQRDDAFEFIVHTPPPTGGGGSGGDVTVNVTHERTYLVGKKTSDKNNNFYPVSVAANALTELKLFEKFANTDNTDWLPNDDGKLVAPRDGVIMCMASVRVNIVNGLYHAITQINVNGKAYRGQPVSVNTVTTCDSTVYAQIPIKAGDIISVSIQLNVATVVTQCTLSAFYIDPKVEASGGGGGSGSGAPVEVKASTLWGSATKNGNMSLTASTWTRITALTDRKDFAAPIKLDSSGCFVAPKNGIILVNGGVEAGSTSGMTYVYTKCNIEHTDGSITSGYSGNWSRTSNGDVADSFSQVMPVVAGDKIWLTAYAAVAAPIRLSYLDISYLTPELDVSGGGSGGGESGGGTGNVSLHTVRTENDYDAANGDFVIAAAPVTITLANLKDAKVDVKRMTKDGAITVRAESGSIDEYAEVYLYTNKETASFICDGENWYRA